MSSGFRWDQDPEDVWAQGFARFTLNLGQQLHEMMQDAAPEITLFMQQEAPWMDRSGRARHGLRAISYWDPDEGKVGILVGYSPSTVNPDTGVAYGELLEKQTFPNAGVLSIILARRTPSVYGDVAPALFDRIRARF